MTSQEVEDCAAAALWRARLSVAQIDPAELAGLADAEAAYRVQRLNVERRLGEGGTVTGRKIGLTSAAVQAQLNVDEPDYGFLFADMDVSGQAEVSTRPLAQPRIEAEIAFVVARDLPEDLTPDRAASYVDHAVVAAEIVDSAVLDWRIGLRETVADNASAGRYALGSQRLSLASFDPTAAVMRMTRDGQEVSTGAGAACLGGPLLALCWLARAAAARGVPVRAGEVVLSGALGPMIPVSAGDCFEIRVDAVAPCPSVSRR
ncbi:2-keto-4-pentenoate hydratase [Caulobacter mirabilis]|uniref:2-keto-4-pentenoate hydratase n=1 Tax=Caulobacter mirabilis TaxID=69666 RepID=A0A2D2B1L3_9CAUL|nr:fumarylacetoacetate hydrolase family protein [Caulobacter mirabilis]ATQ44149.1 2-keto-4-pentenoate hydratase [Caulobacter mirabilis]